MGDEPEDPQALARRLGEEVNRMLIEESVKATGPAGDHEAIARIILESLLFALATFAITKAHANEEQLVAALRARLREVRRATAN
jgi:hypothetical protein